MIGEGKKMCLKMCSVNEGKGHQYAMSGQTTIVCGRGGRGVEKFHKFSWLDVLVLSYLIPTIGPKQKHDLELELARHDRHEKHSSPCGSL